MSKKDRRLESERMIMVAAEKVFAEAGFGGATMQLIADVAGLPKANLHYYFPTKEALYRRVVQDIFQVWLKAADIFDQASGPVEGIGAYIDAKMEISRRHPAGSKVWASEVMHGAPVIQDYLETTLEQWTNGRITVIQSFNLVAKIGIMLGRRPHHIKQVTGIYRGHQASINPALNYGYSAVGPLLQSGFKIILDYWCTVHHLRGPDL